VELLLQCYKDKVLLLPCLPTNWKNGEVKGLRAPGDLSVDMVWADGALQSARLVTGAAFDAKTPVNLVCNGTEKACSLQPETVYLLTPQGNGWEIATEK